MYSLIPNELKSLRQWVCAYKGGKAPMKPFERGGASTTDPATWGDFETACAAVSEGYYDDIGFVFADTGIVGIDIDAGFCENGLPSPLAVDILNACKSYTEISRSGRGFHIFLRGELPFDGQNNGRGVEIYKTKRYFLMTGKRVCFTEISQNQKGIDYVVQTYFSDISAAPREARDKDKPKIYRTSWSKPRPNKVDLRPTYPEINAGSRHICLVSLAGSLRTAGYGADYIYDELKRANETACKPPLAISEIQQIVRSMKKY